MSDAVDRLAQVKKIEREIIEVLRTNTTSGDIPSPEVLSSFVTALIHVTGSTIAGLCVPGDRDTIEKGITMAVDQLTLTCREYYAIEQRQKGGS